MADAVEILIGGSATLLLRCAVPCPPAGGWRPSFTLDVVMVGVGHGLGGTSAQLTQLETSWPQRTPYICALHSNFRSAM